MLHLIPDQTIIWEWLAFAIRWTHVITAIAWIGSSFYFIALDLGLRKSPDLPPGAHFMYRGDNNMYGEVRVLDTDLETISTLTPGKQEALSRVAWAETDRLYVVRGNWDGTDWRLEEVPIDGGAANR